eukprot:g6325.t1
MKPTARSNIHRGRLGVKGWAEAVVVGSALGVGWVEVGGALPAVAPLPVHKDGRRSSEAVAREDTREGNCRSPQQAAA